MVANESEGDKKGHDKYAKETVNEWFEMKIKKFRRMQQKKERECMENRRRIQAVCLKNWEAQIDVLTKKCREQGTNKVPRPLDKEDVSSKILPCQLPPKELNPGSFTLPCTIGSLKFYAMADLGASVNVIPKSMFEFLKLTHLKKTDMLVKMADMTKKVPIGIVENVLVKIDKFLFPSDFVVMDMLVERNETMILVRPFLETIHAEINIFNKEISLRVGEDRITFDMDKKIHNFTTHVEKIHMIKLKHDGEPCKVIIPPYKAQVRLKIEGHNSLHDQNNSTLDNEDMQGRCSKKARINKTDHTLPKVHICRPIKQDCDETFKIWPTYDPTKKENCKEFQGNDTYWWYDHWLEENEKQEIGKEVYDPPKVHLETFEDLSAKKSNLKSSRLIIMWSEYCYRQHLRRNHNCYAVYSLETLTRLHSSTCATKWFKRLVAFAKCNRDSYERETRLLERRLMGIHPMSPSYEA
ncbi:reverse transcriptase domain-containing protein [Tanacetum coccineum]|uniref:Reverse transcriptase domain-containing protein n=1 Tax=Tanacetum coccineum TaxID=301880 RepID=A0ABQ5EXP8_9ASTR